ncbi:MAG: hypothetical protein ACK4TA_01145 [Saprospiraceae bacterium]
MENKIHWTQSSASDGSNLDGLFETAQDAEKFIKEEFQKLYKGQRGTEIFQSIIDNQVLRDSLFDANSPIPLIDQFNALVDNLDSALYQFIKVQ